MSTFTAAIFATKERITGPEHTLVAHALLFEGSRPYWEIHINKKIFSFIPHPDFILEDGLWQLNAYCQIPEREYKHDVSNNDPITLEEEFGEETCSNCRTNITKELSTDIQFRLITWPGVWMPNKEEKIKEWKVQGVNIS